MPGSAPGPSGGSPGAANIQGALHLRGYMGGRKRKRRHLRKDAPKTLYVCRPVLNTEQIITWAKSVGFPTVYVPDELHTTIAYSKTPFDWSGIDPDPEGCIVPASDQQINGARSITLFGHPDPDTCVLLFESPVLARRWRQFCDLGASWSYSEYHPHISISQKAPNEAALWEPYRGRIVFGPEKFSEIVDGAMSDVVEKAEKESKQSAGYTDEARGGESCSICSMYSNERCSAVEGTISPDGWCRLFEAKSMKKSWSDEIMEKIGARNSKTDLAMIQQMHDHSVQLGASCDGHEAADEKDIEKFKIAKVDESLGLVFGYAIICKVNGKDYFDLNRDPDGSMVPENVPENTMLKAAADFMQNSRLGNEMHAGDDKGTYVFAMPWTTDIAKAFGVDNPTVTGLMVCYKPPKEVFAKFLDGTYKGFSIEGRRVRVEELAA